MPEAPALRRRGGRTDRRRSWGPENLVGANDRGPVAYLDVAVTLQRFQLCDKPQMFRLGSDRSGQPIGGMRGASPRPSTLGPRRSEEHTSELQSLMRNSYAVFCLTKKPTQPVGTGP